MPNCNISHVGKYYDMSILHCLSIIMYLIYVGCLSPLPNDLYLYYIVDEAKIRAVEGLPTSQPLAKLLPRLLETQRRVNNELNVTTSKHQSVNIPIPKYMRMHIDNALVETLKQVLTTCSLEDECNKKVWDTYWKEEQSRIESNKVYHGGTTPKTTYINNDDTKSTQISDSQSALNVFQSLDFIAGFHPGKFDYFI